MKGTITDIMAGANFSIYIELDSYGKSVVLKHEGKGIVKRGEIYEYDSEQVIATGARGGLVIDRCKRQIEQMRKVVISNTR